MESVHDEYYQTILNEGYEKIKLIQFEVGNIKNQGIQKAGIEILEICGSIFKALEESPTDIKVIRQFFTYYLRCIALRFFKSITKLPKAEMKGEKQVQIHEQMTQNLGLVKELLHSKLKKLLEDDFIGLGYRITNLK